AGFRIEQRLLAETIARQHQLLAPVVPQRDREHAVELARKLITHLLVEVNDDLGVALRREAVPLLFEALAQLLEVVDLAVLDGPDRSVLVAHRLMATGDVDDAQPAVAQDRARLGT